MMNPSGIFGPSNLFCTRSIGEATLVLTSYGAKKVESGLSRESPAIR